MPGTNSPDDFNFTQLLGEEESLALQLAELIFRTCRVRDSKRRTPRFPVSGLDGLCHPLAPDGAVDPAACPPISVRFTDLGFGGAGIRSAIFLPPGARLRVDIVDGDQVVILNPCTVQWAEAQDDGSFHAGVQFQWLQ